MSEQPAPQPSYKEGEMSIKQMILTCQEFWRELLKYWWIMALLTVPVLGYYIYDYFKTPATYPAELTFMINKDEGGGLGGAAGVLATLGIGGIRSGNYNVAKMLELMRSRHIMQTVLFKKSKVNGAEDYYANHIIDLYDYHEKWVEDTTGLRDFKFTRDSVEDFKVYENFALKQLHGRMIGIPSRGIKPLIDSKVGDKTAIMTLTLNSVNEDLSISLLMDIFEELSAYYVDKSIEKQKSTFDAIKFKTDSIYTEIRASEYSLANFKDTNRGLFRAQSSLKQEQLRVKIQGLYAMYAESVKNQEIAEFGLRDQTPIVQIIDSPIPPIKAAKESLIKTILLGCFLGCFLGGTIIVFRKIYRDIMKT